MLVGIETGKVNNRLFPGVLVQLHPRMRNRQSILHKEAILSRLGLPLSKAFLNLEKYGNTSAAAIAIALDEANRTGAIKKGDYILLVAFGAGLTWASSVVKW